MNIFQTIWADIQSVFAGKVGLTISEYGAAVAGGASAYALIEKVNPTNTKATAIDIYTLSNALLSLLSGTTAPSEAQIKATFTAFKSDQATENYETLAEGFASTLTSYIAAYSGTPWIQVATWNVYGWQFVAGMLGGSATAANETISSWMDISAITSLLSSVAPYSGAITAALNLASQTENYIEQPKDIAQKYDDLYKQRLAGVVADLAEPDSPHRADLLDAVVQQVCLRNGTPALSLPGDPVIGIPVSHLLQLINDALIAERNAAIENELTLGLGKSGATGGK